MTIQTCRSYKRWLAVLLVFVFLAAACGGGDEDEADGGSDGDTRTTDVDDSDADDVDDPDGDDGDTGDEDDGDSGDGTDGTGDNGEGTLVAPVDTIPDEIESPPADLQPQSGGTLRVGVEAESDGLNPSANNFAVSAYITTYPVVEPVAFWGSEGNWVPYLAESFTKIGDGSAWQMKLREGIRFHDGTELDADDVIATFAAQLADPIISLAVRPAFPQTGNLSDSIEKIDDYTVVYKPTRPFANFPTILTSQLGMVLPSEFLARAAEDPTLNQMPVGTGPFMVESRTQDEVTVLVRNPDYWAADMTDVYLDRIEVYPVTDGVIAAERVAAGDLDLMVTSSAEAILTLRESDDVRTIENVRTSEDFAMVNSQNPPFDDIRARKALTFATPRDAYVELIRQGTAPSTDTMFHPDLIWHNPDVVQETDMPDLAGPEVESYCRDFPGNCSDGKINIELQYSGPSVIQTRIADLLSDGWEDYFNVEQQELLQDDHILQVALGQFNVVTWRQFGEPDPDNDVVWLQCDSIGLISINWPRECDENRDALMFEQRASDDLDRRVEIWHEIQQIMKDSYTYIFFNSANWTIGARENVQGICGQTTPDGSAELFCNAQGRVLLHQVWLS